MANNDNNFQRHRGCRGDSTILLHAWHDTRQQPLVIHVLADLLIPGYPFMHAGCPNLQYRHANSQMGQMGHMLHTGGQAMLLQPRAGSMQGAPHCW